MTEEPSFVKRSSIRLHDNVAHSAGWLRDSAGFTLTEVLATVIILGLATSLVATAVTVGVQQFTRSMAVSESHMLLSSLQQDLKNDLSYTTVALRDGESNEDWKNVTGYYSSHHGYENERLFIKALDSNGDIEPPSGEFVTGYGQLALCTQDGKIKNRLLGKAAYNYGLVVCVKEFKFNERERLYKVTLSVSNGDANALIPDETFTIKSLVNKVGSN